MLPKKIRNSLGRRKLTEHLQGPRAALGAVGKEGIEKTKVAACRRQGLLPRREDTPTNMEQMGRQNTLGGKPGGVQRQVVGGCHFVGCAGKASLGTPRETGSQYATGWGGHTPCGTGHMPRPRGRREPGHARRQGAPARATWPGPQRAWRLEDWMTTPVPTRQAPRAHSLAGVTE